MASATLDGRHRENLKKFDKKKESLPKLEKKFDRIEKKLEKLNKKKNCDCTDEEIHLKHSLKKEIKTIEKDIQNIKDNIDKSNYYLETSLLLSKYYDNKYSSKPKIQPKKSIISFFDKKTEKSFNMNDFINKKDTFKKTDIFDEYLKKTDKNYSGKVEYNENVKFCNKCNIEKTLIIAEALYVCTQCGYSEFVIIDSEKPSYKEPPIEVNYFAYKRINQIKIELYIILIWI